MDEVNESLKKARRSKYKATRTTIDGITFASYGEAERYAGLKLLQRQGDISNLELQKSYPIEVNGQKICTYVADFCYFDNKLGKEVIEDFKGFRTSVFKIKKKLMKAVYDIEILETYSS